MPPKMIRKILIALLGLIALSLGGAWLLGSGRLGEHEAPGQVSSIPRTPEVPRPEAPGENGSTSRILFGDLHVHSTFSSDAFVMSLPLVSGEGAHPPADACDFARHCAALDFWSIHDHAESLTPAHWRETINTMRQCAAVGDPATPDTIPFLGWEWTQDGATPEEHWGHKNVLLRGLEDDDIPARPIAARIPGGDIVQVPWLARAGLALLFPDERIQDFNRFLAETDALQTCPDGVPVRELPGDCRESTVDPAGLFEKLDDWGMDALVIPHGTSWGNTAPAGARWDNQLREDQSDSARQFLVEVYSGHGNSEEYRPFRATVAAQDNPDAERACPPPTEGPGGYLPNCWRAGEIIEERCLASGESPTECTERAAVARRNHVAAGRSGFRTVRGTRVEDWQDAGQCRDCFLPAFDYRPAMSAQYMLTRRPLDGTPGRYGFVAASDNHTARPGTGFKELNRSEMTESKGPAADTPDILGNRGEPLPSSVPLDEQPQLAFGDRDIERMSSFLSTGGLTAVHAREKSRDAIWEALVARRVYGTSGPRILLDFALVNPEKGGSLPMGSETHLGEPPTFRVRAVGAREQLPGCPEPAQTALGEERLHALCRDECFRPSDQRHAITRIEVIRLRPQVAATESYADAVDDPYLVLRCTADSAGCSAEFTDPELPSLPGGAAYYVRAIQEPTPAVNGDNLRCHRDERGRCIEASPCHGDDALTAYEDDCLALIEERAWSSPIWIDPPRNADPSVS